MTMMIKKNLTNKPASATPPHVSVVVPATLPTSSLCPMPAALSMRTGSSNPAPVKSFARGVTLHITTRLLKSCLTSPLLSLWSLSRSGPCRRTRRRLSGRELLPLILSPFDLAHKAVHLFQTHVWPAVPSPMASVHTQSSLLDLPRTEEDPTQTQCIALYTNPVHLNPTVYHDIVFWFRPYGFRLPYISS